jgi:lysophospholipase L1-like esterase
VRALVDLAPQRPLGIHDVDHANRGLSFLPYHQRRYETSEFSFLASYNRFGRRDVEWPTRVVADPSSILFVGDSFVYGIGADHEGTLPSLLEARAARDREPREVMNFGMPAGAPPGYAFLLEDAFAKGFRAGTVVAGVFTGNDFYPGVLREFSEPASGAGPREPEAAPPQRRGPRSALLELLRLRASQSARLVGLTLTLGRWLGIPVYDSAGAYVYLRERTPEQEAVFQAILSHLGRAHAACRAEGRRFFIVGFPNRIQVENRAELTNAIYDAERPGRDVLAYCRAHGIPCLDLLPELTRAHRETGAPLFFPIDRHFNAEGYRVAADAIYAFLRGHGVFGGAGTGAQGAR